MILVLVFTFTGLWSSMAQNQGPLRELRVVKRMTSVNQKPGAKANFHCSRYLDLCGGIRTGILQELIYRPDPVYAVAAGRLSLAMAHPYMALIGYGPNKNWLCGGTLISEKFVLSAAHCINELSETPAEWIRLGELDLGVDLDDAQPQDYRITRTIVHPDYRPPVLYNDIVLFELDREANLTRWVRPVCLHTKPSIPYPKGLVAGWGRTGPVDGPSKHLREADISFINSTLCKQLRRSSQKIPQGVDSKTMICAGELEGFVVPDTCQGDSGGPLVVEQSNRCINIQVGITSFGGLCAQPNSPGIYTRVYPFLKWIENHVWS